MRKGVRKWRTLLPFLLAALLCACGDDPDVQVPVDFHDLGEAMETAPGNGEGQGGAAADGGEEQGGVPADGDGEQSGAIADDGEERGGTVAGGEGQSGVAADGSGAGQRADVVSVTISAAGDVTLGTHQEQDYGYSFRQAYDQAADEGYFFENVYDIFSQDDMTLVNLEGPLTRSEEMREGQTYNIKGDPEYVRLLTCGSIEAVSMGNNHRLDYGEQGSRDTVATLEDEGIVYAYDDNVGIYETNGVRVGFVSVNEVYWGAGVEKTLQTGFEKLREEGADLILACCHWGVERENFPEDYQRALGQKCIDWGADLVIGHHPHVLQGIEEYRGKFIVYSLGNFCFGANRNPADKDTMILQQTFTFVDGQKQEDRKIRVIPCTVSSVQERNDFRPTPAQGEDAARILQRINEYSEDFGVSFTEEGLLAEKFP